MQGGSKAPAAERRAELIEALESIPPKLVQVARKIRGNPPASQRGRYIEGLLRGMSGADLMQATGLSDRKMGEHRRWLRSVVKACGVV